MSKKEKTPFIPLPSSKSLETIKGKVSEKKEVALGSGEKKFIHLIERGGGLMGVPDKKEWAGLLNHTLIVRRVATHLAQELKAAGEDIDLKIVGEAALLHDIGRREEDERIWYKKEPDAAGSHAREGAKMLKKAGFSEEVLEVVRNHHFPQEKEQVDSWEKKIVFYTDMRVGQNIMPLDDRLEDIEKRWVPEGITQKEMDRVKEVAKNVEQDIFSKLDIEPNDILNLPAPRVERYLRAIVERNLEDRAIKFFRGLEKNKSKK